MKKLIISYAVLLTAIFGVSCDKDKEESNDPYALYCYEIEVEWKMMGVTTTYTQLFWGNEIQLKTEIQDLRETYLSEGATSVKITSKRTDKTQAECI